MILAHSRYSLRSTQLQSGSANDLFSKKSTESAVGLVDDMVASIASSHIIFLYSTYCFIIVKGAFVGQKN